MDKAVARKGENISAAHLDNPTANPRHETANDVTMYDKEKDGVIINTGATDNLG